MKKPIKITKKTTNIILCTLLCGGILLLSGYNKSAIKNNKTPKTNSIRQEISMSKTDLLRPETTDIGVEVKEEKDNEVPKEIQQYIASFISTMTSYYPDVDMSPFFHNLSTLKFASNGLEEDVRIAYDSDGNTILYFPGNINESIYTALFHLQSDRRMNEGELENYTSFSQKNEDTQYGLALSYGINALLANELFSYNTNHKLTMNYAKILSHIVGINVLVDAYLNPTGNIYDIENALAEKIGSQENARDLLKKLDKIYEIIYQNSETEYDPKLLSEFNNQLLDCLFMDINNRIKNDPNLNFENIMAEMAQARYLFVNGVRANGVVIFEQNNFNDDLYTKRVSEVIRVYCESKGISPEEYFKDWVYYSITVTQNPPSYLETETPNGIKK